MSKNRGTSGSGGKHRADGRQMKPCPDCDKGTVRTPKGVKFCDRCKGKGHVRK